MIPRIIHYCWFGGNPIPRDLQRYMKSWEKQCPNYEIRRWDESSFDVNAHPFTKAAYQAKAWAFVSDYARLKIVYEQGGIYLDTDVELLKSLDELLTNESFFGIQQVESICASGLGFGAERENPIVLKMLQTYDTVEFDPNQLEQLACPKMNMRALEIDDFKGIKDPVALDGITLYPPRFFDPISPGNSQNLLCKDTISIHHYTAAWGSAADRFKRKIIIALGQDRVNMIRSILKGNKQ